MLDIITIVTILVISTYVVIIGTMIYGFLKDDKTSKSLHQISSISILLPFCNEQNSIANTIESVLNQKTEIEFEIVAIDDFSTDDSRKAVEKFAARYQQLRIVSSSKKGKKNALLSGLAVAKYNTIITIDADCIYPLGWLTTMADLFLSKKCDLLAAPVKIDLLQTWFDKFQFVDFASLVGSGIGAAKVGYPIFCNGANLMFSKESFLKLKNPYNLDYESGDDVFLLHAIKQQKKSQIVFTANPLTIATTQSKPTIKDFLKQRVRWAGKTSGYTDIDALVVAAVVALTALIFCVNVVLLPFVLAPFLVIYITKLLVDTIMLLCITNVFGNKKLLIYMPIFEFFVALYTTVTLIIIAIEKLKDGCKRFGMSV